MRRLIGKASQYMIISLAVASVFLVGALFVTIESVTPPSLSTSLATVQHVSADSWLVFDVAEDQVLYAHNETEVLPIASVTKLAAAHALYNSDSIWATTTITWPDVNHEGRAGTLRVGEVYRYHTLLFPLLLESSNDAAGALARGNQKLIGDMNVFAESLGLSQTQFTDASGLSPENVSTAEELRSLARNIYFSNRHLIDITGLKSYLTPQKGWLNNNPFTTDSTYIGGKHGFIPEAGDTAVSFFAETLNDGSERVVGYIVLKSSNLEYDMQLLRNHVQHTVSFQ